MPTSLDCGLSFMLDSAAGLAFGASAPKAGAPRGGGGGEELAARCVRGSHWLVSLAEGRARGQEVSRRDAETQSKGMLPPLTGPPSDDKRGRGFHPARLRRWRAGRIIGRQICHVCVIAWLEMPGQNVWGSLSTGIGSLKRRL